MQNKINSVLTKFIGLKMHNVFFICLLALALSSTSLFAATKVEIQKKELLTTEKELKEAKSKKIQKKKKISQLNKEINKLRKNTSKIAKQTQEYEFQLIQMEKNLDELKSQLKEKKQQLKETTDELADIILVLQRIAKNPKNSIILYPGSPEQAIQSTALLKSIIPNINKKKEVIKLYLLQLVEIDKDLNQKRSQIKLKTSDLNKSKKQLLSQINLKQNLQKDEIKQNKNLDKKTKELANKIKTIKTFLQKIAEDEKKRQRFGLKNKPSGIRPFPKKGKISSPVAGKITKKFKQKEISGKLSDGITIQARRGARVVAPFDGYISYSGKFGKLGNVIVISHDGGYNSVLVGLGKNDVSTGQWILRGEPIGTMPNLDSKLDIEIRRGTNPVNPLKWLDRKIIN